MATEIEEVLGFVCCRKRFDEADELIGDVNGDKVKLNKK
jgi:hypothetical protein